MQTSSAPSPKSPASKSRVSKGWIRRQLREIGATQSTDARFGSFEQFCSYLTVPLKEGGYGSFAPEHWHEEQRRFNAERTGRDLILKARQIGATTLELARDLFYALTNPGTNVLIVVHEKQLAAQMFERLQHFTECLRKVGKLPPKKYSTKQEIVFADTGSAVRIIEAGATTASAEKKGRSGTVHRLHATELAFWGAASETMSGVLQAVPSSGEIVEESTANGIGGLFHADVMAAREGRNGLKLHFFPWYEHREYRIDPLPDGFSSAVRCGPDGKPDTWETRLRAAGCDDAQIAFWRSKVDDPKVGLEAALKDYPITPDTCFRASGQAWLEPSVLDKIAPRVCEPLRPLPITVGEAHKVEPARIYAEPVMGDSYVVFGDVSEGVANDGSAATVLHRKTKQVVATWWSNTIGPGDFGSVLAALGRFYNRALVGVERNNHGHAALERLNTVEHYPLLYTADDGREGWVTNTATRAIMWDELATAIRDGSAWTPDAAMLAECRSLIRDSDGKPRARGKLTRSKDASRDDRFVSWAGAWQIAIPPAEFIVPKSAPASRWAGSPGKGFG